MCIVPHKNEITLISLENAVYMNYIRMTGFDKNFKFSGQEIFGKIFRSISRINHFARQPYRFRFHCSSELT